MDIDFDQYKAYRAALKNNWAILKDFYRDSPRLLSTPISAAGDNPFHLAVFSQSKEPLQSLLNISEKDDSLMTEGYLQKNSYGNTALHEAATNGNLEAVEALINHHRKKCPGNEKEYDDFLEQMNTEGETPLFKAAAFGQTEVVKFLAAISLEPDARLVEGEWEEIYYKLKPTHRQNKPWINMEPKPDAASLPCAIVGEITLKPKPGASNLVSAILDEIILKPKPSASNRPDTTATHDEKSKQKPDASNTAGATATKKKLKREYDASILQVAVQGNHFETALYLSKVDETLAELKDRNGWTSLHQLATMPSAFKSGYRWGPWIHRVIYFCLPVGDDEKATTSNISQVWLILLGKICALVTRNTFEEKRKHYLASKLAEKLIEKDLSWEETIQRQVIPISTDLFEDTEEVIEVPLQPEGNYKPIPLFLATEGGIVEIVNRILEKYPQLVEHKNDLDQNILHLAIQHRQYDIFHRVITMKIPMTRLVRMVDKNGYTILHHAAHMEEETTKILPSGPVYELQEEINWYKRVEEITPSYYRMLRDKKENMTCEELFKTKHDKLLERAQQWIKETSQSCSTVAVLVATVVFAAAYTLPGGSNEKGYPVFLHSTLFLIFTVMDVIALACSLTSVVMFLSVLTSPYTYDEFHHTLPRKLTIGFALLFISLATTMLAFAATLLLIVRSKKPHWTTTLVYTAAFFPVSIFALTQFPMYAAFEKTLLQLYRKLSKNRHATEPDPGQRSIANQAAPMQHQRGPLAV